MSHDSSKFNGGECEILRHFVCTVCCNSQTSFFGQRQRYAKTSNKDRNMPLQRRYNVGRTAVQTPFLPPADLGTLQRVLLTTPYHLAGSVAPSSQH